MRRNRGFTLLELVVVIAVFGVFAVMAYGGLQSVLDTRRHLEEVQTRTGELQRGFLRLRGDMVNAANRTVRDNDGQPLPAFLYDGYNKRIEFTRGGWSNPLALPRSTLERVSYFLDEAKSDNHKLIRRSWRVLDRAPQTEAVDLALIEHVDELRWRFMDKQRAWQEAWPPGGSTLTTNATNMPLPLAIEMTLRTRDWGELKFLFQLGAAGYATFNWNGGTTGGGSSGGTSGGNTTGSSGGNTSGGSGDKPAPPPDPDESQ